MGPVLVFGHKNPDNDSICSAVAYAHLKNVTDPDEVYVPARLGEPPPETAWLFERFGLEMPEALEHVRVRARDAMSTDPVTVDPDAVLTDVGALMRAHGVRALPVVGQSESGDVDGSAAGDGSGRVLGIVTMETLARRYVEDFAIRGFAERPVRVSQLAETLDGELLAGEGGMELEGDVLIGAMEPDTMRGYLKAGDTLIVGDRLRTQPMALEEGVACLVVTGGLRPEEAVLEAAREKGAAVVVTRHDTYGAARLIDLSERAGAVMATDVLMVSPEALLSEVAEDLFDSPHREALVVDGEGSLVGILTRTDIARSRPRRVVLVDHNENAQSVAGIEQAEVVEIVDHHRVGDVETAGPVLFLNMPVGATATIIADRYEELCVEIPRGVAGALLAAILTDTVILRSPTTAELDRRQAERLAGRLELDIEDFGMELFRARQERTPFSAERAVTADLKEYRLGEHLIEIAQLETVDAEGVLRHRDELGARLARLASDRGADLALLMVTDIMREGTELLAAGNVRLAERAFGETFGDAGARAGAGPALSSGSVWLEGVLSRKKQVAPRLAASLGT